jgi:hypothetical protein
MDQKISATQEFHMPLIFAVNWHGRSSIGSPVVMARVRFVIGHIDQRDAAGF